MRLTVRILGAEVFHVDTTAEQQETGQGDATSYPVGFTESAGDDVVWQGGVER